MATKRQPAKKAAAKTKVEQPTPTSYDPRKNYKWSQEHQFKLDGIGFAVLINQALIRKQEILKELEAIAVLESLLKDAVEKGDIVEAELPKE